MSETPQRIAELIRQGKKIEAIKLLRETTGIGLKEAKDEVDRLSAELAGQALPLRMPNTAGESVSKEVLELAREGRKIEAIKRLREQTGLGLKEAKEQVEELTGNRGSGCASVILILMLAWVGVLLCF